MSEYQEHNVWRVKMSGDIEIEAIDKDTAIQKATEQFIAGKGTLSFEATLEKVLIDVTPPPPAP